MVGDPDYAAARAAFDAYAGMDAPDLPEDRWSATQVRLARWEVEQFGAQPPTMHALGMGEELGELVEALRDTDEARIGDAVGDLMVFATQWATGHRLDFGVTWAAALLMRARKMPKRGCVHELHHAVEALSRVNRVALKSAQRIRGMGDEDARRRAAHDALAGMLVGLLDFLEGGTTDAAPGAAGAYFDVTEVVLRRDWRADPARGGS